MNNKELERYQQQVIRKQRLELMLKNMMIEKESIEKSIEDYGTYLILAKADIKECENVSLASLYYNMFADKYKKVGREELEKYAISAKFNLLCKELVEINKEIERTNNELSCLQGCEKRYIGLLKKELDNYRNKDAEYGSQLMELENKMVYLNGQRKEMNKAIEIGQVLLRTLGSVKNGIDSAKNWGNRSSLEGKEHQANKKYQYIENTQNSLCRMQILLRKFYIELNEVNVSITDQVIIYECANFVYGFYDGLFGTEGFFRNITQCQCELKQMRTEIIHVIKQLKVKCAMLEEEEKRIREKREELEKTAIPNIM